MSPGSTHHPGRVDVIEVVGVAGSGKSTLTGQLVSAGVRRIDDMRLKDLDHLRIVIRRLRSAMPRLMPRAIPWLGWTEMKLVLYLESWDLHTAALPPSAPAAVADQGPVYALARLLVDGGPFVQHRHFMPWYHRMVERWAAHLDSLVWLDAPNEVLWRRIEEREQEHSTKRGSRNDAFRFLDAYRAAYERVIADVTATGAGCDVIELDTGAMGPAEVLEVVNARVIRRDLR